jgi:hypothetical protein
MSISKIVVILIRLWAYYFFGMLYLANTLVFHIFNSQNLTNLFLDKYSHDVIFIYPWFK